MPRTVAGDTPGSDTAGNLSKRDKPSTGPSPPRALTLVNSFESLAQPRAKCSKRSSFAVVCSPVDYLKAAFSSALERFSIEAIVTSWQYDTPGTILDDAVFDSIYLRAKAGDLKICIAGGSFSSFTPIFRTESGNELYGRKGLMVTAKALVRQETFAAVRIAKLLTALSRTGSFVFIQISTGVAGLDWTSLDEFQEWICEAPSLINQPLLHGARQLFTKL